MPLAKTRTSTSSASGAARSSVWISNGADRTGTTAAVIFISALLKPFEHRFPSVSGTARTNQTGSPRYGRQRDPHRGVGANAGIDDSPTPADFHCWTALAIARP